MKPIITKQEAVTTYTITLTKNDMDELLLALGLSVSRAQTGGALLQSLTDALKEADAV
jgi:hypothetical protein